jgi:D-xylose transport system substrate-binding protein
MNIRTTLVIVSLVLSVVIGFVIARGNSGGGGAAGGDPDRPVKIGLSLDTLKEARWQADSNLFQQKAAELGATVEVQSANSDDVAQLQQVTTLLTSGIDVLVIVPHDGTAMAKAVRLAHDQRPPVPVIAYDRLIRDSDLDLYLSFNNVRVGQLQAQFVIDAIGGRGNVIRMHGAKTDNNAFLFKQGQDEVLEPYLKDGRVKVIHEDWADDWKPENAKRIVNAAISANPGVKIDAVLVTNDGTAGGAVQALNEEGITDVVVTGQDAELVAVQRILNGTQSMTVYKPLHKLATRAAEVAVAMGRGRPVVANSTVNNGKIDVPAVLEDVVVVTKDNVDETIIKDGFLNREDVYRGGGGGGQPAASGR